MRAAVAVDIVLPPLSSTLDWPPPPSLPHPLFRLPHGQDIRDTIAGVCGSIACVYAGGPFDVAKTRMQTRPDAFKGMVDCVIQTYRREGFLAFWKGSTASTVSNIAESAVVRCWAETMVACFLEHCCVLDRRLAVEAWFCCSALRRATAGNSSTHT
jgi:hypothetical protein